MYIGERLAEALDGALDDTSVWRLEVDHARRKVRLFVEVFALPMDEGLADPRRILDLSGASEVRILLTKISSEWATSGEAPVAVALTDLDAVNGFLASLTFFTPMYDGPFINLETRSPPKWWTSAHHPLDGYALFSDDDLVVSWPDERGPNTLRWFMESLATDAHEDGHPKGPVYVIEGLIRFDDLDVTAADGSVIILEDFIRGAGRAWNALSSGDRRLSTEAQAQANRRQPHWNERCFPTKRTD